MSVGKDTNEVYEFGPFRMEPDKQLLLRGDKPVPLTPKAFDTLLVLVRHSKEVVSKDELMKAVWPDTFVEEVSLTRNIFSVRSMRREEIDIAAAHHAKWQVQVEETSSRPWLVYSGVAILALLACVGGLFWHLRQRGQRLTEKDTIVLTDFDNKTGETAFDDTLKQ